MELAVGADGDVALEISNARALAPPLDVGLESTGLGQNLMRAFAMQLGGQIETTDTFSVWPIFRRQGFDPEDGDQHRDDSA